MPVCSIRFNSVHEKLSWQIRLLDFDGPWGWGDMDAKALKYVHGKLAQFETRTWAEVNHSNTGCHPIKIKDLCSEAQKRLVEIKVIGNYSALKSISRLTAQAG